MSSEQPWPKQPGDLGDSQQQYVDPYQAQPYPSAPYPSAQGSQEYAAGTGYGYAGYGDTFGYGGGNGNAGYPDAGYGEQAQYPQQYGQYEQYGQYSQYGQAQQSQQSQQSQQYEQYEQLGQSYGQQQQQYAQPYEQQQQAAYEQQTAYEAPSYGYEQQPYEQQPYEQQSYGQQSYEAPPAPQPATEGYGAEYGTEFAASYDGAYEGDGRYGGAYAPAAEPDADEGDLYSSGGSAEPSEPYTPYYDNEEPARPPRRDDGDGPDEPGNERKPKKKRRRFVAVAVVGLLVVVGVGAYEVLGKSDSGDTAAGTSNPSGKANAALAGGRVTGAAGSAAKSPSASPSPTPAASVTIPASPAGLTQMTNKIGQAGVSAMQKAATGNADLANAQFAEYEKSGSSTFVGNLTLVQLSKAPDLERTYSASGPTAMLGTLDVSALTGEHIVATGVPGAAIACGQLTTGGNTLTMCVWVDPSEYGMFAGPKSLSDTEAEQYAEAIETASEH